MYRNTYVKVEDNVLKNNIREIKKKYSDYEYYIGVVKANAYGHGFYTVKALKEGGINYFACASLEEAIKIRKHDTKTPILCLEPISKNHIDMILKHKVTITIDSLNTAKEYANTKIDEKIKVHLKLDTGMNRLGIKSANELKMTLALLDTNPNIEVEGIYTHLATTGVYDAYYDKQVERFKNFLSSIDISKIKIIHLGRSLTLVQKNKLDMVNGIRMGIVMYGYNGSIPKNNSIIGILKRIKRNMYVKKHHISPSILQNDLKVQPCFHLYTEIMALKSVKKGSIIGYGAEVKVKKDMRIAILPIGFADGMKKEYKHVVVNKVKCPILSVCMDMTTIQVPANTRLHNSVEIFGDTISVKSASRNCKTNVQHTLTSITNRVVRVYDDLKED